MQPLLAALAVTAFAAPPGLGAPRECDAVVDAAQVRLRPHSYAFHDIPAGDRASYPATDALVTCRIDATGRLDDCVSTLGYPRGPWVVRQLRFWKVLDTEMKGCPLAGRQIRFRISFLADDGGLRWRSGPRWEAPLNP